MVKRETIQRKASPTAMLIGLPETLAAASWRTAAWRSGQDAANVALIRTLRSS